MVPRLWLVSYIEVRDEGLASCKQEVKSLIRGFAKRMIDNGNRLVTSVQSIPPVIRRKKAR